MEEEEKGRERKRPRAGRRAKSREQKAAVGRREESDNRSVGYLQPLRRCCEVQPDGRIDFSLFQKMDCISSSSRQ